MDSIYDVLLQMPLFQGLSLDHFTEILEKVRFDFRKANDGEVMAYQGDPCTEFLYIIRGTVSSHCERENPRFQIMEYLETPELLEPYSLMGYDSSYTSTYRAYGEVNYVAINKSFVLSTLCEYEIFRLNFLNMLSRRTQLLREKVMLPAGDSISLKVWNWMWRFCEKEYGRKLFMIRMEDLAEMVDETRLNVSKLLNEWETNNLLHLGRLRIEVPRLEAVRQFLSNKNS